MRVSVNKPDLLCVGVAFSGQSDELGIAFLAMSAQQMGFHLKRHIKKTKEGTWGAQWVKHLTLDSSSGPDLMVHEFEPRAGFCADGGEPAWDSLSPPLCSSRTDPHSLKNK